MLALIGLAWWTMWGMKGADIIISKICIYICTFIVTSEFMYYWVGRVK